MTALSISNQTASHVSSRLRSFGEALKRGFISYAERRSRMDQINSLNAMTDEELAEIGVKRDYIVHHVYRDLLHI
ncbi:hypothetical protein [Sedimentitalea sp.]|uniref:hypothetical protein n=1 Tax=Sedimentitalea sp. TaxID=2048915 RepID=UPI0032967D7C